MFIKKGIVVYIFFFSNLFSIPSDKHILHAQQWLQTYIESPSQGLLINSYDVQLLANLCYFSYMRSASTIVAQQAALKALENSWQGWQNIAALRMNPSKDVPFIMQNSQVQTALYQDFIAAQHMHHTVGKSYAHIAELCVKTHAASTSGKIAIKELRRQARPLVVQTFTDIKTIVDALFDCANHQLSPSRDYQQERFNVINSFWSQLSAYGAPPFIELEQITHQAHDTTWFILDTLNLLSAQIWNAIETARCDYYQAHYSALIATIKKYEIDKKYTTILEDQTSTAVVKPVKKLPLTLTLKSLENYTL